MSLRRIWNKVKHRVARDTPGWVTAGEYDPDQKTFDAQTWRVDDLDSGPRDPSRRRKKRSPSSFRKKLTPSPKLAAVVGSRKMTRAEAVKAFWRFVKRHGLQSERDGRVIHVRGPLKALFPGKKQIRMTQVAGPISRNLR